MSCVKTGASIFLVDYGLYAYGDAFRFGDHYLFRVCHVGEPAASVKHFSVANHTEWFDRHKESSDRSSTLVVPATSVFDHGYEGVSLT